LPNWNLKSFDNLYASLAESAYRDRPTNFVFDQLNRDQKNRLKKNKSVLLDFSTDGKDSEDKVTHGGGTDLPNGGKVYLQPDNKKLLENEETGYHAYYVTDTETINANTHQTYFSIRGSDGFGIDFSNILDANLKEFNSKDWINNDAAFALTNAIVPQAQYATKGMKEKIAELEEKAAPDAKMDVTAHSLGTMVSVQGLAGLDDSELNHIGKAVLFDGPDTTLSLIKAGYSLEKLKLLDEKIVYYVNPFDPVSMLNRDRPWEQQLGQVNVVVPIKYTSMTDKYSSHDFGAYQIDSYGNILTASESYHPELLVAGQRLAKLNKEKIDKLRTYIPAKTINRIVTMSPEEFNKFASLLQKGSKDFLHNYNDFFDGLSGLGIDGDAIVMIASNLPDLAWLYYDYQNQYDKIIKDAQKASLEWDRKNLDLKNPNNLHNRIKSAGSYAERILLRTELLYAAVQLADAEIEQKVSETEKMITTAEGSVKVSVELSRNTISALGWALSASERESLMTDLTFEHLWDSGIAETDKSNLKNYKEKMSGFSKSMIQCAQKLVEVDAEGAADIFGSLT
jgi:conserved domain protein